MIKTKRFQTFDARIKEDWKYSIEVRLLEVYLDKDGRVDTYPTSKGDIPLLTQLVSIRTAVPAEYDRAIHQLMRRAEKMSRENQGMMYEVDYLRHEPNRKVIKARYQWIDGRMESWLKDSKK